MYQNIVRVFWDLSGNSGKRKTLNHNLKLFVISTAHKKKTFDNQNVNFVNLQDKLVQPCVDKI